MPRKPRRGTISCYNSAMIRAVIFDCYGVLTEDGWTPFKRKYITGNDELEMQIRLLGRDTDTGKRSDADMMQEIARLVGVDTKMVYQALVAQVPNEKLVAWIQKELKPMYKIGMLSNAGHDVVNGLFADTPELFDAVVLSYQEGVAKPDGRIFELAAQRLGVSPGECLFIDDQARFCAAAEAVGMQAVVFENDEQCIRDVQAILQM